MNTFKTALFAIAFFLIIPASLLLSGCGGSSKDVDSIPLSVPPAIVAPAAAAPTALPVTVPAAATTKTSATDPCAVELGSFDLTATGFSGTAPTGTATYKYFPCANMAMIFLPGLAGSSNADTFTAGPLPSFLIPATIANQEHALNGFDNGVEQGVLSANLQAGSSTITYAIKGDWSGWTTSGSKGVGLQVITVFLD